MAAATVQMLAEDTATMTFALGRVFMKSTRRQLDRLDALPHAPGQTIASEEAAQIRRLCDELEADIKHIPAEQLTLPGRPRPCHCLRRALRLLLWGFGGRFIGRCRRVCFRRCLARPATRRAQCRRRFFLPRHVLSHSFGTRRSTGRSGRRTIALGPFGAIAFSSLCLISPTLAC